MVGPNLTPASAPSLNTGNGPRIIGSFNASAYNSDAVNGQTGHTAYYWAVECHLPQGATSIGLVWSGMVKPGATQTDTPIAQAVGVQAWLEYPSATYTRITFGGGGSTGTIEPGGVLISDIVSAWVPERSDQTMVPRLHVYVPSASASDQIPTNYATNGYTFLSRTIASEGGTTTISTVPFAVANSSFTKVFTPRAVIGTPAVAGVKSIYYIGDSIAGGARDCSQGWAQTPDDQEMLLGILARTIGPNAPFAQCAVSGSTAVQTQGPNSAWPTCRYANIVIFEPGINDATGGATFAAIQAACLEAQAKATAQGCLFAALTLVPPTSDGGTINKPFIAGTGFSQSLDVPGTVTAVTDYNAWLRSGPAGIVVVDINKIIDPDGDNFWPVVSPVYTGTGNIANSGGSAVITDTSVPGWTAHQWSSPADGLGPYMVWLPATNVAYPIWDNGTGSVTISTTVGQYPSAPTGSAVAYQILDLWTWEGEHPLPRAITRIGNEIKRVLAPYLGWS